MKYGNIGIPIPDFKVQVEAINDLYDKGTIDIVQRNLELSRIAKARMAYIVLTNGGHTPKKIKVSKKISDKRTEVMTGLARNIRDDILAEEAEAASIIAEQLESNLDTHIEKLSNATEGT